jgi:hypothetical protein
MADRFDDYQAHIHMPFNLVTSAANLFVTDLADLESGFGDFVDMLASQRVDAMIRVVKEARRHGPDEVSGIYETNLLAGGRRVVPAFFSRIWLHRFDGVWKATKIRNTTRDNRWPIQLHNVQSAAWPPLEILK